MSVVERRVEVPMRSFGVQESQPPMHGEWLNLLHTLAVQFDSGAVYAREIPKLTVALNEVLAAYERHPAVRPAR